VPKKQKPNLTSFSILRKTTRGLNAWGSAGIWFWTLPTLMNWPESGTRFTNAYVMGGKSRCICAAVGRWCFSWKEPFFHVLDKLEGQETNAYVFFGSRAMNLGTGKWHNEKRTFEASFPKKEKCIPRGWQIISYFSGSSKRMGKLSEPVEKRLSQQIYSDVH